MLGDVLHGAGRLGDRRDGGGLPDLADDGVVISSARASSRLSASSCSTANRSSTDVRDHPGKASAAARAARSTSSADPAGIVAVGSSVTGLITVIVPSPVEGTHSPLMNFAT